ncbi:hypothetical protein OsI_02090 [Oryza sativa Indica Group]|uniref:Uncharacterized protein n=1 Tax=Oryza sativa subsp. indica TaxID=39946 RepID=A2WQG3_ORYSI|nr:hypothetical protein OsI_02090 [Oryza sativa Indica Group]
MRYKGWTEKGSKRSRRHKCPICKSYGHHWHNCKEGDPEEVAAMLAERGPPKKRTKKTNEATSETSIMAAPIVTPIMAYPPSQNFNFTEDNRTLNNSSSSSISITSTSLTGSNQLEQSNMIVALPCLGEETPTVAPKMTKSKTKGKPSCSSTPGSPAMSTRSKNKSPAMGTRSKRKLMD